MSWRIDEPDDFGDEPDDPPRMFCPECYGEISQDDACECTDCGRCDFSHTEQMLTAIQVAGKRAELEARWNDLALPPSADLDAQGDGGSKQ